MLNAIDPKDRWYLERHTKWTASQIFRLLGNGAGGKGFDKAAMTYIEEKAIELMTDLWEAPKLEFVESLLHGRVYEEPAFYHYVGKTGNTQMEYYGTENPVFIHYNKISGGSPDGLAKSDGKVFWVLELKCPATTKVHFNNLKLRDQWDLKQSKIQDYTQCQMLIMSTGANGCHWMSYDERFKDPELKGKIIEVLPDKNFMLNLDLKIKLAEKERRKVVEMYSKFGKAI